MTGSQREERAGNTPPWQALPIFNGPPAITHTIEWRNMMADETELDETRDERDIEHDDNTTPDETHRVGEFDDLRDRLSSLAEVSQKILEGLEAVRSSMAAFVEGGATIREDGDGDVEEVTEESDDDELEVPIEELDFDLD